MKEAEFINQLNQISQRTGYQLTGDDAAIINDYVFSTDQFVENIHFSWELMNAKEIGYKAITQALSDIAAMAASPVGILTSIAWPESQDQNIPEIFRGMEEACLTYKAPLIGGDITRSPNALYIDVTAIGKKKNPKMKSGAKVGDLLALSGPLGSATAGLLSLQKKLSYPKLIERFKKPQAQIKLAEQIPNEYLTSLTDISDSLHKSVHQIGEHSKCGFIIHIDQIPFDSELENFCKQQQENITDFLIHGGEDYQLLMTLSPQTPTGFIHDYGLSLIGTATKEQKISYLKNNQSVKAKGTTWDPFDL